MKAILLTDIIRYPLTGIGRYTLELVKQFDEMGAGVKCVGEFEKHFLSQNEGWDIKKSSRSSLDTNFRLLLKSHPLIFRAYPYLRSLKEKYYLRKYQDYVVHSPNYYLPNTKSKRIVTIHDLSMFFFPDCFEIGKNRMMQEVCLKALRGSNAIITISQAVKEDICSFFSYPVEKVYVTPLACGGAYRPRAYLECGNILKKFNLLYKSFTLYVGTIEPRKNLSFLIRTYKELPYDVRMSKPLVVVGYKGWRSEKEHELMHNAANEGWLVYLSYVSDEDLFCLYSSCSVFCLPSLYEGFGLPVLEAMSSGVPVVCSKVPALQEVGGNAPVFADIGDTEAWKRAIFRCLEDVPFNEKRSQLGLTRAKDFSWSNCAKLTLSVYNQTLQD